MRTNLTFAKNELQLLATLVENLEERDRIVDHDYEKIGERLDRHHRRWEVQQEALKVALDKIHILEVQIESMAGKLCHCGGSAGSEENPIEVSDSEDDGGSLYAEPMVAEESEEIPQVSGRLVVRTTTRLTLS